MKHLAQIFELRSVKAKIIDAKNLKDLRRKDKLYFTEIYNGNESGDVLNDIESAEYIVTGITKGEYGTFYCFKNNQTGDMEDMYFPRSFEYDDYVSIVGDITKCDTHTLVLYYENNNQYYIYSTDYEEFKNYVQMYK